MNGTEPRTLGKSAMILRAFTADRMTLSLTEIREASGLSKTTTHRLLGDLVDIGLVERDDRVYRISGMMFELGMLAAVERMLLDVASPILQGLRDATGEVVHLGIRDGVDVLYLAKIAGPGQCAVPSSVGGRMPLHATALGKVLLAHAPFDARRQVLTSGLRRCTARTVTAPGLLDNQLRTISRQSVAREYEEAAPGLACVATLVRMPAQRVAAISLSGPVERIRSERHAQALTSAARSISDGLSAEQMILRRSRHAAAAS